ncbi:conserved hypothetical protein [Vibrio cholerae O1 str. 2010EL-1786]|uniref:Uncharacterized protein n=2 Tax=Vibrio cholerae TaxID=666 RepID=Q9KMR8_VIBCH|nr:hypothetical protein VC_A0252 [Vibrio cholerae O1 biovar El Tor str. N16961]ACP07227.1 conserved hypothetical protein [Vibrio cholerae M66-2]ACP11130.1 conserved hypothetical protein [Vibrio cholerae O395]AET29460.1 conserved hypothetical protein [Vibrio cholerae O1 str. 2010EL-1786]
MVSLAAAYFWILHETHPVIKTAPNSLTLLIRIIFSE